MIREFGLSIKFRWSGGGKKMKKWLSEGSDEQETRKNGFPRARMSRKQEKMAFRGLGRAENKKKWLSETSDEQKTEKKAFRGLG